MIEIDYQYFCWGEWIRCPSSYYYDDINHTLGIKQQLFAQMLGWA